MKQLLCSIAIGALVLAAAYYQRGYWAVGAEILLPTILFIILSKEKKEKENEK